MIRLDCSWQALWLHSRSAVLHKNFQAADSRQLQQSGSLSMALLLSREDKYRRVTVFMYSETYARWRCCWSGCVESWAMTSGVFVYLSTDVSDAPLISSWYIFRIAGCWLLVRKVGALAIACFSSLWLSVQTWRTVECRGSIAELAGIPGTTYPTEKSHLFADF